MIKNVFQTIQEMRKNATREQDAVLTEVLYILDNVSEGEKQEVDQKLVNLSRLMEETKITLVDFLNDEICNPLPVKFDYSFQEKLTRKVCFLLEIVILYNDLSRKIAREQEREHPIFKQGG